MANLIEDNQQVAEFFIGASVDPQGCMDLESSLLRIEEMIEEIEEQNGGFAD